MAVDSAVVPLDPVQVLPGEGVRVHPPRRASESLHLREDRRPQEVPAQAHGLLRSDGPKGKG